VPQHEASIAQRTERLRTELTEECELTISEEALEELAHCRYVRPHEGRRPTYGAVVWPAGTDATPHVIPALPSLASFVDFTTPVNVIRRFANGRSSFVVRRPGAPPALVVDDAWLGTEQNLAAYSTAHGVVIVQRLATGRIRIFADRVVHSFENDVWMRRPTANVLRDAVIAVLPPHLDETATAILEFCVHWLSPASAGASLVWLPGDGIDADGLKLSDAWNPPELSLQDIGHRPAIAHALAQFDLAAVVDDAGVVRRAGVRLEHGQAQEELDADGGMRHKSARSFSAFQPNALVFVVSADGPVTVFRAGEVLAAE
jgi:hypothetical protein